MKQLSERRNRTHVRARARERWRSVVWRRSARRCLRSAATAGARGCLSRLACTCRVTTYGLMHHNHTIILLISMVLFFPSHFVPRLYHQLYVIIISSANLISYNLISANLISANLISANLISSNLILSRHF